MHQLDIFQHCRSWRYWKTVANAEVVRKCILQVTCCQQQFWGRNCYINKRPCFIHATVLLSSKFPEYLILFFLYKDDIYRWFLRYLNVMILSFWFLHCFLVSLLFNIFDCCVKSVLFLPCWDLLISVLYVFSFCLYLFLGVLFYIYFSLTLLKKVFFFCDLYFFIVRKFYILSFIHYHLYFKKKQCYLYK